MLVLRAALVLRGDTSECQKGQWIVHKLEYITTRFECEPQA